MDSVIFWMQLVHLASNVSAFQAAEAARLAALAELNLEEIDQDVFAVSPVSRVRAVNLKLQLENKKMSTPRKWPTPLFFFCNDDVSRLQDELPEPEPHECRATSQPSQLVCWVHVFENSKTCFFGALQALKIYKSIKILSFFSQNLCPFWCLPLVSNRYCPPLNCLELTCRFGSILSRWLKESCPQPP